MRRETLLAWLALAPMLSIADPLPALNQNPLLSGLAPLSAIPARIDPQREWMVAASYAWGSSAIVESAAGESLIVDAETRELRLTAQRNFSSGYALRVQLPYRHTSAGSLDGFIDRWHDTFSLPEGDRPSLPQDALRMLYRHDGATQLDVSSATQGSLQGFGDASVELGKAFHSTPDAALSGWLGLRLPTGKTQDFTGSESLGLSLSIAGELHFAQRWQAFGQIGGAWIGEGERFARYQREWLWSAAVGLSARALGQLYLTAQLDAHSAVFDSELDFLGDAMVLSVGGSYRFVSGWELTLGVSEDIAVETAPDVVFLFELEKSF